MDDSRHIDITHEPSVTGKRYTVLKISRREIPSKAIGDETRKLQTKNKQTIEKFYILTGVAPKTLKSKGGGISMIRKG